MHKQSKSLSASRTLPWWAACAIAQLGISSAPAANAQAFPTLPTVFQTQLRPTSSSDLAVGMGLSLCGPLDTCYHDNRGNYTSGAVAPTIAVTQSHVGDPASTVNSGSTVAQAAFGAQYAQAHSTVTSTPPAGNAALHQRVQAANMASADAADILTITSPGLDGQRGLVRARVSVQASFATVIGGPFIGLAEADGASGAAQLMISKYDWIATPSGSHVQGGDDSTLIQFTSDTRTTRYQTYDPHDGSWMTHYDGPHLAGTLVFDVAFLITFGRPFGIDTVTSVAAYASTEAPRLPPSDPSYQFPGYADSNASFSVTWAGISSVTLDPARTLATGNPLPYGIASASGIDYSLAVAAVPEPSASFLLALGVLVVGWVCRRT